MAHYLRDQSIKNLTVNESILRQINDFFISQQTSVNSVVPEGDDSGKSAFLTYIIRFDGKGYRIFNISELLQYFHQANKIERVIFTLETGESLRTGRKIGGYLELILDDQNPDGSFLISAFDDKNVVDSSFSGVKELLDKCKSWSCWMRTAWTRFMVQIVGVAIGFIISFWAAVKISPMLAIENSFIICFLFSLLIFSNIWTHLNERINYFINNQFPNLKFYRPDKDRMHWVSQAIIGGMAFAITWCVLNEAFIFIGRILSGFLKK